jgi:hypothetical protein
MKFTPGERFFVIENGLKGTVVGFEHLDGKDWYYVDWDESKSGVQLYEVSECDPIWEHECPVVQSQWRRVGNTIEITVKSPQPIEFIPIEIDMSKLKVECNGHHTWVNVGFHFTKEVCRYCDVERKLG